MSYRSLGAIAVIAGLIGALGSAQAHDESKYPNWKGQWTRLGGVQWDMSKPGGRGQQAPLTAEYQKLYEVSLAEQDRGGQDYKPQVKCLPAGMPQMMIPYEPLEFIVTPDVTYIWTVYMHEFRRIFTDGRKFPEKIKPAFKGYSVGTWLDTTGNGEFDTLEVETRGFKGPRTYEPTGIPLHEDNQSVFKERFRLDSANPDVMEDEITTIDNALTRPWKVTRKFKREAKAAWAEYFCNEANNIVILNKETYFLREDGYLTPSGKDQPAPNLTRFGVISR